MREYKQIPSLEPDPRRVLRSLGQDSGPAARTATTHTWARGGARRHGDVRAPYTIRGAADTGRACTAAAATGKESKRSAPTTPSYHTVFFLSRGCLSPSLIG